jgi:hypothetical protein
MGKKAFTDHSGNLRLATIGRKSFKKLNESDMGYEIFSCTNCFKSLDLNYEKLIGEGGDNLGYLLRIVNETTWKRERKIK